MGAEPQLDLPAPPDHATGRKRDATGQSRQKHGPYRAGQRVDVLDTVNKWAEADVVKVDSERRRIKVAYVGWSARWDEWLSWDDDRVSPHHSQTYIAGARPRPGQRIEAKDDRGQWLEAEVLEVRDDAAFCHYKGFHRKFDEWLPLEGSRLRPFGSTKPRREVEIDSRDVVARSCDSDDLVEVLGVKGPKLRERQVQGDVFERYRKSLQRRGLRVHRVEGDGNCLFRSVSHQVYGDDKHHGLARRSVADYMSLERPFFQSFVEGDGEAFDRYISEKRRDGSWGDEPEIQALCELYDRPCEVWAYDAGMDPRKGGGARVLRTFHGAAKGGAVMRLSYYGGGHYDSLVNDSDEFDPLADPGSRELLALQKARARKTNADASSALAVSDAEATERAAVEQALSASRAAYDGASDLEAALQASLSAQREAETSDLQSELDAAALRRAEDDDLARAIALSSDAAPQQGDADLAAAIDLSAADAAAGDDFLLAQALAASIEDT